MTRPILAFVSVLAAAAFVGVGAPSAHDGSDSALARAARGVQGGGAAASSALRTANIELVAHHDLNGSGFNADVYSFGNFAYVGVWSGPACPATGVKVVDISRPAAPVLASVLQNPPATSAEDVVVRRVNTPWFRGDLAVAGIQSCTDGAPQGLQFFDVTNPYRPVELGFWTSPGFGCHEIDLVTRSRQVLAACASPFAWAISGDDEVHVVDASNPRAPVRVGSFGGVPNFAGIGCFAAQFAHSVRFGPDGRNLYASYWDAGVINLDITDPASPTVVGSTGVAPDEDGDFHSSALGRGGNLLFVNPEDFSPVDEGVFCTGDFDGWGDLRIYDNSDPANPTFLSSFATANAASKRTDGFYSVHNTEVLRGNLLASSWYSDGIRLIDITDPAAPREAGAFVPPAAEDPYGFFPTVPIVWGVWPHNGNLVLASDINSGLWILRVTG
jgi:hypothetical protein